MIYNLIKSIIVAILIASDASATLKLNSCTDLDHGRYSHFDNGHFAICVKNEVVCYKNLVSDTYSDGPTEKVDCSTVAGEKVKRNLGVYLKGKPWPKGVMCYKITGDFSSEEREYIEKAAGEINAATSQTGASALPVDKCKPNEGVCGGCRNYVDIQSHGKGCISDIGYVGNVQNLNLAKDCFSKEEGTPLHEFGHALGLFHEHAHPKRGVILIESELKLSPSNYIVKKNAGTTPYDQDSIMHYSVYDGKEMSGLCIPLAKYKNTKFCGLEEEENGSNDCVKATIQHCDAQAGQNIGKTKTFSAGDIATLKAIYKGGSGKTETTSGKPNPKTGSKRKQLPCPNPTTGPNVGPRIQLPGQELGPRFPRPSIPHTKPSLKVVGNEMKNSKHCRRRLRSTIS